MAAMDGHPLSVKVSALFTIVCCGFRISNCVDIGEIRPISGMAVVEGNMYHVGIAYIELGISLTPAMV
ncbi:MAG: hypothetical protein V1929_08290 [bacterium]